MLKVGKALEHEFDEHSPQVRHARAIGVGPQVAWPPGARQPGCPSGSIPGRPARFGSPFG
jgi:hypothetical protein